MHLSVSWTTLCDMALKHHTQQIPIEQVQNTMTLAVKKDGRVVLFQVNSTGVEHVPPNPALFVLKSEELENGEQWVIKKPAGTMMVRILRETYDDGT